MKSLNGRLVCLALMTSASLGLSGAAQAQHWPEKHFSDDTTPDYQECKDGIVGWKVSDNYSNNNKLSCAPTNPLVSGGAENTLDWFSDEAGLTGSYCPPGQVVTKIACRNPHCDDLRFTCRDTQMVLEYGGDFYVRFTDEKRFTSGPCNHKELLDATAFHSDRDDELLVGAYCSGPYCLNKTLLFCRFRKPDPKATPKATIVANSRWIHHCPPLQNIRGDSPCTLATTENFSMDLELAENLSESTAKEVSTALTIGTSTTAKAGLGDNSVEGTFKTEATMAGKVAEAKARALSTKNGASKGLSQHKSCPLGHPTLNTYVWYENVSITLGDKTHVVELKTCETACSLRPPTWGRYDKPESCL